jgi:hypothetical protein
MTWGELPAFSTFEKARRKALARRLARLVRGKDPDQLLSLDDVREHLGLYEQWYVGIRSIPVSDIVGSVDRAADFDRAFLPKRGAMEHRWKRVEQAFTTEAFPPIVAFKVGDAYFIEDGHHRVAIARQRKDGFIDAEVTEVKTPVEVTAATDVADLVHMGLRQWFMRETQLDRVRPDADIDPSRPHSYAVLLDIIQAYGFELMMERQEMVGAVAAAAHWHDALYLPTVEKICAGDLPTVLPRATETDLYLRVHAQHRELASVAAPHSLDDAVGSAESAAGGTMKAKARLAVEDVKDVVEDVKEKVRAPARNNKQQQS